MGFCGPFYFVYFVQCFVLSCVRGRALSARPDPDTLLTSTVQSTKKKSLNYDRLFIPISVYRKSGDFQETFQFFQRFFFGNFLDSGHFPGQAADGGFVNLPFTVGLFCLVS